MYSPPITGFAMQSKRHWVANRLPTCGRLLIGLLLALVVSPHSDRSAHPRFRFLTNHLPERFDMLALGRYGAD